MWMINPELMCSKHLNDEHREIHRYVGQLKKQKHVIGYCKNNLIEIKSLYNRHFDLVNEMSLRDFNHDSPLYINDVSDNINHLSDYEKSFKINIKQATEILCSKCEECKYNIERIIVLDKDKVWFKNGIIKILTSEYNINENDANKLFEESKLSEYLDIDPIDVFHKSLNYWSNILIENYKNETT